METSTNTLQMFEWAYLCLENFQNSQAPIMNTSSELLNAISLIERIKISEDFLPSLQKQLDDLSNTILKLITNQPATPKAENAGSSNCNTKEESAKPVEVDEVLREFLYISPDEKGFTGVCARENTLKEIRTMFILPLRQSQLFTTTYNSLLLHGPPGCGKTQLVHALSKELNANLYCIMPSNVVSPYVGATENKIRTIFETVRSRQDAYSIIFIDELDAFCRKRNNHDQEYSRRIKIEFMHQLNAGRGHNKLLVIAATNMPWDIDSAMIRRFQYKIHLGLPDAQQRADLLRFYLADHLTDTPVDTMLWQVLIKATEGHSNSDLKDVVHRALHIPIKELNDVQRWNVDASGIYTPSLQQTGNGNDIHCSVYDIPQGMAQSRQVDLIDLINATKQVGRSVDKAEIDRFQLYMRQ